MDETINTDVNKRILKEIKNLCPDEDSYKFLSNILGFELSRMGEIRSTKYKDIYLKLIEKYGVKTS